MTFYDFPIHDHAEKKALRCMKKTVKKHGQGDALGSGRPPAGPHNRPPGRPSAGLLLPKRLADREKKLSLACGKKALRSMKKQ